MFFSFFADTLLNEQGVVLLKQVILVVKLPLTVTLVVSIGSKVSDCVCIYTCVNLKQFLARTRSLISKASSPETLTHSLLVDKI